MVVVVVRVVVRVVVGVGGVGVVRGLVVVVGPRVGRRLRRGSEVGGVEGVGVGGDVLGGQEPAEHGVVGRLLLGVVLLRLWLWVLGRGQLWTQVLREHVSRVEAEVGVEVDGLHAVDDTLGACAGRRRG